MTSLADPIEVALLVGRVLDRLGIAYTIGGSLASSFAGEPRASIDIDFVAAIEDTHVSAVVEALAGEFYVDAAALRRAIQERSTANLIHHASQLKVDLFVAGGTPLDRQQLERRLQVTLSPGRSIWIHPPEDILLQKLHWFLKGGETSERQWRDILGIVKTQGRRLDRDYLTRSAPMLGVERLLGRALREAGGE